MQKTQELKTTEFNPFLYDDNRFMKMMNNYNKFGNLVIGVDFDFTLNDPVTKETYLDIVSLIKELNNLNFKICIWTANEDREYVENTWNEHGLKWECYNYSPINPSSLKPHFNILLDDSAGLNESVQLCWRIINFIKEQKCKN